MMKNRLFASAILIITLVLGMTVTGCFFEDEDENTKTSFIGNSIGEFSVWLSKKPENSKEYPYNAKLNVSDLRGDSFTSGSLGNALYTNFTKYVSLDLSGSTFTSIGDSAFYWCNSLTGITIPNSVTSIGDSAFSGTSLTSITIPNSVTSIGDSAFIYCTNLTSVTIPDSVTSIGDSAFGACYSLTSVTIGNGVTSIGDSAFIYCTNLTSVTIGNGVTSIGAYAFDGCNNLTSVTIGSGVTSIGTNAFPAYFTGSISITWYYNPALESSVIKNRLKILIIPDSVTSIEVIAFQNCTNLTSVTIGNGVTSIGGLAFDGCSNLTSVTIPDSVITIGDYAFQGCTGLTSVTIPDSVTSIGLGAFGVCSGLTSVTFATGSNITDTDFGDNAFPEEGIYGGIGGGNTLKTAYSTGKAGTYTREANGSTWTKQE